MRWSVFVTFWLLVMPAVAAAETRIDISPSANFSRYKTYTIEVSPPVRYGQVDEDDTILGVIDWEFAYAAPAQFALDPPWWLVVRAPENWEEGIDELEDVVSQQLEIAPGQAGRMGERWARLAWILDLDSTFFRAFDGTCRVVPIREDSMR